MPVSLPNPRFRRYHTLMPHRVQEVLLVSTLYHAFVLQEDGDIEDQVFLEYRALSLSSAPVFTHVTTGAEAMEALERHRFDIVLVANHLPDQDVRTFARRVRALHPRIPLVLLAFHTTQPKALRSLCGEDGYDAAFVWTGNAKIMLAISKLIEDRLNVDHDIAQADVGVILLVEESPNHTSAFLAALYPALMRQSSSLFAEGLNRVQRLIRMRTRPKVLHATTEEEARALYDRYRENLFAVVSEVGFEAKGHHDPEAGLRFARRIRAERGDLPVLLQSGDPGQLAQAREVATVTVDRRSPHLLGELNRFLVEHVGFGDFVFILPDGAEVDRAADIAEFARKLATVPDESLRFHASQNHISVWLLARSEFRLARKLKRLTLEDFPSLDAVREFLIAELDALARRARQGVIRDADPGALDPDSRFQRLGNGSLGGKARGIAFLDQIFSGEVDEPTLAGIPLQIPRSVVLTTEAFDQFLEQNGLDDLLAADLEDEEIQRRFLRAELPDWIRASLRSIADRFRAPLAVRSSSLLEDDLLHPFAGIYGTAMLPNAAEDPEIRERELALAVKYVFSTTYCKNARAYVANTNRSIEEEKMAVLVQELVGQRFGDRFYPHFAGVARSYNFYPIPPQRSEDGIAQLVLGLGNQVVDGGKSLRFCPRHPGRIPGFGRPQQMLAASQSSFQALDLSRTLDPEAPIFDENPRAFPLETAREDGTLRIVGSVYDQANDRIVEDPGRSGPWLITFNNLLVHRAIPLADALVDLLRLAEEAVGNHVEIELACDMGDWGRRPRRGLRRAPRQPPTLSLLQVRPAAMQDVSMDLASTPITPDLVFCQSSQSLGHGRFGGLRHIVYVRPDRFDPAASPRVAMEIGEVNAALDRSGDRYVLIGPGRWGSSDPWLGVPVQWAQISRARIIVEASPKGYLVDPSQGSHFFHNITALGIGYLTVAPGATPEAPIQEGFVDWGGLASLPARMETEHLRVVVTDAPIRALINGRTGVGTLAWPAVTPQG